MKRVILCVALFLNGTFLPPREAEGQASTQEKKEFKEITIRIGGSRVRTAALLDAAAKGATVTGIADFDSLSAVYGLMGIYRKGVVSGFYGLRISIRFPPDSDVAAITEAYQNLSYITGGGGGMESKRETEVRSKYTYGLLGGTVGGFVGVLVLGASYPEPKRGEDPSTNSLVVYEIIFYGLWCGNIIGSAAGVSLADPHGNFFISLAGSALLGAGVPYAVYALSWRDGAPVVVMSVIVGPAIGATLASELWEKFFSPADGKNPRFSLGLTPNLQRGLQASATLHF